MKFALSILSVLAVACTVLGGEAKSYVLSNGVVTESASAEPAAAPITPVAAPAPPSSGCYQDAAGNWICPLNGRIVRAAPVSPQACFPNGCPCLAAKTPFDPATNCGSYACPANGGTGNCPCSAPDPTLVNFAGGVDFPLPMAGAAFFLDAAGRHHRHHPFVHLAQHAAGRFAEWNTQRPKLVRRR